MIMHNRRLWSNLKTMNVTVSVKPTHEEVCVAYRVHSGIDTGLGPQRIVLNALNISLDQKSSVRRSKLALDLPQKIGTLECIYTRPAGPVRGNIYKRIMENHKGARIELIVPEVVAPGDYMVFRKPGGDGDITVIEALRIINDTHMCEQKNDHAL